MRGDCQLTSSRMYSEFGRLAKTFRVERVTISMDARVVDILLHRPVRPALLSPHAMVQHLHIARAYAVIAVPHHQCMSALGFVPADAVLARCPEIFLVDARAVCMRRAYGGDKVCARGTWMVVGMRVEIKDLSARIRPTSGDGERGEFAVRLVIGVELQLDHGGGGSTTVIVFVVYHCRIEIVRLKIATSNASASQFYPRVCNKSLKGIQVCKFCRSRKKLEDHLP
jgi:hypothetical protein